MSKIKFEIFRVFAVCVCLTGFSLPSVSAAKDLHQNLVKEKNMDFTGTVVYKTFEGGFYGLDADSGRKFTPLNLPKSMQIVGARVKIKGTIKEDIATTKMYGEVLEIDSIELLEEGKAQNTH